MRDRETSKTYLGKGMIAVVCIWLLAFVFREGLISFIEKFFPCTSLVPNKNWSIQLALIGVVTLLYALNWKYLLQRCAIFPMRLQAILAGAAFFFLFRYSDRIEYYHVPNISLSYIGMCFLWALLIELALIIYHWSQKEAPGVQQNDETISFVYDVPTKEDSFRRETHAETLINKIVSTLTPNNIDTSFCILLNEQYGAGKTSFFNRLKDKAEKVNLGCIEFRPWLSDSPSSMLQDFLLLLEEELRISSPSLAKDLQAYARIISGIHVGFLELAFNSDLRPQSLTSRRDELAQKMKQRHQPLLVLVDDVDRLDSQELLSLLKLIRNTADFPYLCYILAADKESISKNLKNKGIIDTDLYLRKFFNLELTFPPVDNEILGLLAEKLSIILNEYGIQDSDIRGYTQFIAGIESIQDVFSTPRDVYRFINLVSFSLDIIHKGGLLSEVNVLDVLLVNLVQFISPEWYKVLRDRNDKLLDYDISRGRYVLNKERVSHFYTSNKLAASKDTEDKSVKTVSQVNQKVESSLNELIDKTNRDPLNAMKDVIYGMFGSLVDYKSPERICYKNEYFKYFAGHYRNNELTTAEAFAYIKTDYPVFSKTINRLNQDQIISLLHKIGLYVDEDNVQDRVDILKKIMKVAQKKYSFSNGSIASLYHNSAEERLIRILFLTAEKTGSKLSENLRKEKTELVAFLDGDTRYSFLSAILKSMRFSEDYHFVYGDDLLVKLQEALISRFIYQELKRKEVSDKAIRMIPDLRNMYPVFWEESFKKYIIESKDLLPWFYRFITVRNGTIVWNNTYIDTVFSGLSSYQELIQELIDNQISQELMTDLKSLLASTKSSQLSKNDHPFIAEALEWQRINSGKKTSKQVQKGN